MSRYELLSFGNPDELAHAAAHAWLDEVEATNRMKPYCVALSGGRIATNLFSAITEQIKSRKISLHNVHFFWADERCVPPNDPESNFKMVNELLFTPLKISPTQIHRIHGETQPEAAAKSAVQEISRFAPFNSDDQPVLDLIFLGIGPDGHTASLFPGEGEPVLISKAIYRAVMNSPKPPPKRITLGYPAIGAARQVWFLVSGAEKAQIFTESLKSNSHTPFARVLQKRTVTKIFTDFASVGIGYLKPTS